MGPGRGLAPGDLPLHAPDGQDAAQPGQPSVPGTGLVTGLPCVRDLVAVVGQRVHVPQLRLPVAGRAALPRLAEHDARMVG
jgi:hypothetical protein